MFPFKKLRCLVVGDVMLDHFVKGDSSRISQEAPVPVFRTQDSWAHPGGAGNVALGIKALGAQVQVLGVIGADSAGQQLKDLLKDKGCGVSGLLLDRSRPTTTKTRYITGQQQMLRVDSEDTAPLSKELTKKLISKVKSSQADAVMISDYAKGVLGPELLKTIISHFKNKAIVVDPQGDDYKRYRGATTITPNRAEALRATGIEARDPGTYKKALAALQACGIKKPIITLGPDGMILAESKSWQHFPSLAQEVFDVTGAGDTVAAVLTVALGSGCPIAEAAQLANEAAAITVAHHGTVAVSLDDIQMAQAAQGKNFGMKILSLDEATQRCQSWRQRGEQIVFTNGCFDIIHAGHLDLIRRAKEEGQRLVVALNNDDSVRRLKGNERPIVPEQERAEVLAALTAVDAVVIFNQDKPTQVVKALKPDILVKGEDYRRKEVAGRREVESRGGRVIFVPMVKNRSSSRLIRKIKKG